MAKPLTQTVKDQIRALSHLPMRDIARQLGVSLGAVQKTLRSGETGNQPRVFVNTDKPVHEHANVNDVNVNDTNTNANANANTDVNAPDAPVEVAALPDDDAILEGTLRSLLRQREAADANGDVSRGARINRDIADIVAK